MSRAPKPRTGRAARIGRVVAFLVLLGAFAFGAVALQRARLAQIKPFRPYLDSLVLPRTEYAKALAFGYDMVAADFLYIRAIQAFGGQWRQAVKDYSSVFRYFHTVTEMDPHFMDAYAFGSLVIGEEGGDPEGGIALNHKGWLSNPDKYITAYNNAYACYFKMNDPERAKYWAYMATTADDCPEYVRRFLAFFDKKMGRFEVALEKWLWEYLNSLDTGNDHIFSIASKQLRDIANEWNIDLLHRGVEHFRDDAGRLPDSLEELVWGGYLLQFRACDYARLMVALQRAPEFPGKAVDQLERIAAVSFGPVTRVPRPPFDGDPMTQFYFLRKGVPAEYLDAVIEGRMLVMGVEEAEEYVRRSLLPAMRRGIKGFRNEHGRFPDPLEEVYEGGEERGVVDPLTGTLIYDPRTGEVRSPTFPDL